VLLLLVLLLLVLLVLLLLTAPDIVVLLLLSSVLFGFAALFCKQKHIVINYFFLKRCVVNHFGEDATKRAHCDHDDSTLTVSLWMYSFTFGLELWAHLPYKEMNSSIFTYVVVRLASCQCDRGVLRHL